LIKNILLIGHKSFVGNSIGKLISEDVNFKVFFLDKHFLEKDIFLLSKEDFNEKYFSKFKEVEAVITCLHIHKNKFDEELALNIKAYENILHFVKFQKIKKIIYLSSVNVSENKSSSYAYIKNEIECLFDDFKNFIIVRPSTIISIDDNKRLLGGRDGTSFNLFEKLFNYNLPIPIIGDGKYLFTFCFLNDLSNFVLFLLKDDIFLNKKINFFSGEFLNFNTFIDYIAKIKNKSSYKIYLPLFFINILCKLKIFNHKNIDNLLNQRIYYNYYYLIKKKITINQLVKISVKK
jgi:nucleoside-diphosphate-sugar epimerase